jgi:hypothetical protein
MTAHSGIEFGAARTGFQLQFSVEREDFEKIAMRSGGRTWSAVIAFTKIICALDPGRGRAALGDSCCFRIDVPDDPVRKQTARRIRIIDNQDQRFRFIRDATDLEFRTDVRSGTGEFRGNIAAGLKGRTGDRDRRSAIHIKNSDKKRGREPYRFHSGNLWPPEFLVKEALSEGHASASPDAQKRVPPRATPFDKLEGCRPSQPRHSASAPWRTGRLTSIEDRAGRVMRNNATLRRHGRQNENS